MTAKAEENNMWIRSQNKKKLVYCKKICYEYKVGLFNIRACEQDDCELIGTYKSEERALEVLDEIQTCIIRSNTTQYEYFNDVGGRKIEYTYSSRSVYQMPKE